MIFFGALAISTWTLIILITQFHLTAVMINDSLLIAAWTVINCLDAHSTWFGLKKQKATEGNPVFLWLFKKVGLTETLVLYKTLIIVGLTWIIYNNELFKITVLLFTIMYTIIVVNNYRIIYRHIKQF